MMVELFVNMGQIRSLETEGILTTVGLGSCVGVTLYDAQARVGVMGHIFLPKQRPNDSNSLPGKYADTGIPAMVSEAVRLGALKSRLVAKLAGGANLFSNLNPNSISIGEQNVIAVKKHLAAAGIPIRGQEVLGTHGRKMRFCIENGSVTVTAIGKTPIRI